MQIPFVGGSYTAESSNINAQRSVNFYPVLDNKEAKTVISMYGTPGLKVFSSIVDEGANTVVRGIYKFLGNFYTVIGASVYSVSALGIAILLGTISTSRGNVFIKDNGVQLLIVDGTNQGYYIQNGTLNLVTDADFPTASSLTFSDGYFIVTEFGTGKFYISGLYNANSWDALDFASAESSSDTALSVINNTQNLWIFGEKSVEIFYNSGATDFPYQRISGAALDIGLGAVASVVQINGILYWLSNKGTIVRNTGYQFQVVSTDHVSVMLSKCTTLSDAIGWTYSLSGHDFYVLTFPTANITLVFDTMTEYWHEMQSYNNKDVSNPYGKHRGNCAWTEGSITYVGDFENGKIYTLDKDTYTDNSEYIRRIRQAQVLSKDRKFISFYALEIEFEAGVGLSGGVQGEDPQAMLDWSDDGGHTWSNEHWVNIGKIGEYTKRAIWRQLGISRNRIYRLTVSDSIKWVIIDAQADIDAGVS